MSNPRRTSGNSRRAAAKTVASTPVAVRSSASSSAITSAVGRDSASACITSSCEAEATIR